MYHTLYMLTTIIAAAILLMLGRYSWQHRHTVSGAYPFFGMTSVLCGWMTFWCLELLVQPLWLKMVMNTIRYSFVVFVAYTIHVFLVYFSGWHTWLRPQRLLILAFVPVLGGLLIWTNPLHHLVWEGYTVVQQGIWLIPKRLYGPWFSLQIGYNYILTVIGLGIIMHTWLTQPKHYHKSFAILLLGTLSMVFVDLLWILGIVQGIGIYPFSVVFMGSLFAWAVFRYQFLDLIPIAYHVIFAQIREGIVVVDTMQRVITLNQAAETLIGNRAKQYIGQQITAILPPEIACFFTDKEENDQAQLHPIAVTLQQGETQYSYEVHITPLYHRFSKPMGQVLMLRDVTKRKEMEQELRESEHRFRMLAENARHVIFRIRLQPTRCIEYVSPSLTDLTGYTPAEAYADPDFHLKIAHPESRSILLSFSDVRTFPTIALNLRYRCKDGREIWVEQEQWAIFGADATPVAIEGVVRDITLRKQAEQQVIEQQKSLTMLHERACLARELHDNLGQVLGYIHMQSQGIQEYIQAGTIEQAMVLVEQVIQVSQGGFTDIREYLLGVQVHTAIQHPDTQEYGQSTFVLSLEKYIAEFSRLFGIQTSLFLSPILVEEQLAFNPSIETHLLRIIQEALSNVRKHAKATQGHVTVTFTPSDASVDDRTRDTHDCAWLTVVIQDDGQGFTPHPTPTSCSYQRAGGYGYGIESIRSRTAECGGTLTITSAPGAGTSITVHIPIPPHQVHHWQPIRVLLSDDNPLFLSGIANLLNRQGFLVVGTACDGIEVVEQAIRLQPDIILMDVHMPGGGGVEATRVIKQQLPDCAIVMLTVSEDEQHVFDAMRYGASGYLLKNIDGSSLGTWLHGLAHGEIPLSPGMAEKILREFVRMGKTDAVPVDESSMLHTYEIALLSLVAKGLTYAEVAEHMHFSERSVKRYMRAIIQKLHLKNRADAITYARQRGLGS